MMKIQQQIKINRKKPSSELSQNLASCIYGYISPYLDFRLKRWSVIPVKRQITRINEFFSARPTSTFPVLMMKTLGPTSSRRVLT